MTGNPGPTRVPLEALLLAIRHSRVRELSGTDALRSVLASQYRELVRDGALHLAPVWDLLESQPGFSAADAMPPFALLRSWEPRLSLKVELPPAMADLSAGELAEMAASLHVPSRFMAHVWRGGRVVDEELDELTPTPVPVPEPVPPSRPAAGASRREQPAAGSASWADRLGAGRRRGLTALAIAVALAGFGYAGVVLLGGGSGERSWSQLEPGFAGEIPLARAERAGPEVGGTLADEAWLSAPDEARRAQMRAALERLPGDVEVFFVRDPAGRVRATARWFGGSQRMIDVTLR